MASGTLALSGSEQTVVEAASTTGDAYLDLDVDLVNMQSGDTVVIRVYKRVDGTNYRLLASATFSGAQTNTAVNVATALWHNETNKVKVTAQQTAGTNRNMPWHSRARV